MAQSGGSVSVNFRMDAELKANVEDICQKMGMTLSTALTIFCKKVEQERRIPFEITGGRGPVLQRKQYPLSGAENGGLQSGPAEAG